MVETLSHHPNNLNIHDKMGCKTQNGKTCTACCEVYEVKTFKKLPGIKCQYQQIQVGCGVHNRTEQPHACKTFHCSQLLNLLKNPLIADEVALDNLASLAVQLVDTALESNEISEQECHRAIENIMQLRNSDRYENSGEDDII